MTLATPAPLTDDLPQIRRRAHTMRRHVLRMAEIVGQGYVGQGLGIADVLAVLYFGEMRFDPRQPKWPERDRLPTGGTKAARQARSDMRAGLAARPLEAPSRRRSTARRVRCRARC